MGWWDMRIEDAVYQDIRKIVSTRMKHNSGIIKNKYSLTDDDLIHELWMTISSLSTRKSTKKYREHWLNVSWDVQNEAVRKVHLNWLTVEYKGMLKYLFKHNVNAGKQIKKEEWEMYNFVEPEEKYLAELRWQIMTEVADEDPFIWAMINWKLEIKPYQQLLDEWKLKPSTLTYHWKKFKDECLLVELKLRDTNPYVETILEK